MRVYPRTCGGTREGQQHAAAWEGLSPHVRGNLVKPIEHLVELGSIPARAGEPRWMARRSASSRVYPRTCGGTWPGPAGTCPSRGLSPHVRGNRGAVAFGRPGAGSIPARAGEPSQADRAPGGIRVYPRTCGGTEQQLTEMSQQGGLSPHVRGNRRRDTEAEKVWGSIPARAGEPCPRRAPDSRVRVYPRTCGGTILSVQIQAAMMGLSPHVRGNRPCGCKPPTLEGSIPARAGEPRRRACLCRRQGVYPRTCGGTGRKIFSTRSMKGLSPHVRGNLEMALAAEGLQGSIPARAGEPSVEACSVADSGVYPRTCGGTHCAERPEAADLGLSPHVRGNLEAGDGFPGRDGSIPARAGEPSAFFCGVSISWVYPRTCGGTSSSQVHLLLSEGLSPHVRGNRAPVPARKFIVGSIPARAGEPRTAAAWRSLMRVYPRTCGGTSLSIP